MIFKAFLVPFYLLQNRRKNGVRRDTEDNPQLSNPFLLLCQWFFSRDHKPKLKDRRSKVFLAWYLQCKRVIVYLFHIKNGRASFLARVAHFPLSLSLSLTYSLCANSPAARSTSLTQLGYYYRSFTTLHDNVKRGSFSLHEPTLYQLLLHNGVKLFMKL